MVCSRRAKSTARTRHGNLNFIRETMERAGYFTTVPGWPTMVMGFTAVFAALMALRQSNTDVWLSTWLAEGELAGVIATWTVQR